MVVGARHIYRRPSDVFDVLRYIVLMAQHRGQIGRLLHEAFGARARYKAKDSPETMTTFGGERVFRAKSGSRKEIQQHVTLGHGMKPDASLQIYFDITAKGVVEVGHVGAHLRTVSENT